MANDQRFFENRGQASDSVFVRHAWLEDPHQLGTCLDKISWGFRGLHGDASFSVDPRGSVYFKRPPIM
jgi:hypothetical protein